VTASPALQGKARIREDSIARILRAAEKVFAQSGMAGATMAQIAAAAGMPTATIHYYFRDKVTLYRAVLEHILRLWLEETAVIGEESEPRLALAAYIRAKMRFARIFPDASRVFAAEIMAGAPHAQPFLDSVLRPLVDRKAAVIEGWCRLGKLREVNPHHLLFLIWAATEFYANFSAEVAAVLEPVLDDAERMEQAANSLVAIVLDGCIPADH
jgi:TetR/AcrR family transcriptional regulator